MTRNCVKSLEQAQEKAAECVHSKRKVGRLLSCAIPKARENYKFLLGPWESLQILLRMIRSWLHGRYAPPILTVIAAIAAIIYFVEPLDLIPDAVPVLGYVDDAAVIAIVVRLNLTEISKFRNWEASLCRRMSRVQQ
jgi:uncharacterized membrane protein YkvA (DUF1232 family)